MSRGRHRKSSTNSLSKKVALGATITLGAAVVPATFAGSAHAATETEWDRVAQCESGGRWGLSWGDSDSTGGLQIQDRTWADFGGTAIAPHAYMASKSQQIQVAEKILARQGPRAWSVTWNGSCPGASLSSAPYVGGGDAPPPTPTPTPTPPPPPAPTPTPTPSGDTYTVKKGDYLVKIAADLKIEGGWQALYDLNKAVIGADPNLIEPGMVLKLPKVTPPPVDPYKDGLPQADKETPSAKPLQGELKRVGILDKGVVSDDMYGPATQASVAYFHRYYPQFRSVFDKDDVQIGPKGWQFLRNLPSCDPLAPKAKCPVGAAPLNSGPHTTPTPTPPPAPSGSGYVSPLASFSYLGDGIIIVNGCISRTCGGHSGQDIIAPSGTPVVAPTSGVVVGINGAGAAYGNHIVIKHAPGVYTLYAHLSVVSVSIGQSVSTGQKIGNVGSTGSSSGAHLHFEVRNDPTQFSVGVFSNPLSWLRSHGVKI